MNLKYKGITKKKKSFYKRKFNSNSFKYNNTQIQVYETF